MGSLESLQIVDVPIPHPGEGEVMVQIRAAGLNPSDIRNVLGSFPYTTLPRTPGRDFAGVVIDGPGDMIGMEVWGSGNELGFTSDGSHAEYMTVGADGVSPKPKNLSFVQAASCGVPYVTAWEALERTGVREGTKVLVIGAAGSVGTAAVELAKAFHANVVGAVRREEQATQLEVRGFRSLLLREPESVPDSVRKIFAGGAEVIFDTTGAWLPSSVAALAKYGRIAVIVAPKDGTVNVPIRMLYRRGGSITGVDSMLHDSLSCATILSNIRSYFENGIIPVPVGITEWPLENGVAAYREMEKGSRGKMVLV